MTEPDWQGRRTPREGMLPWTMPVLLFVLGLILLLVANCAPKESHGVPVPTRSAQLAAADRLDVDRDDQAAVRASRSRRASPVQDPGVRHQRASATGHRLGTADAGFERWRTSQAARAIVQCESGNDGSWAWHHGTYRGYWQIGPSEWRDWGGLAFATSPERASRVAQDEVAYRGYLARGWQPWTCARILGYWP